MMFLSLSRGSRSRTRGWRALSRLLDPLKTWRERARSRHALGALDDRLLRDIGVTRGVVLAESTKPFWRA